MVELYDSIPLPLIEYAKKVWLMSWYVYLKICVFLHCITNAFQMLQHRKTFSLSCFLWKCILRNIPEKNPYFLTCIRTECAKLLWEIFYSGIVSLTSFWKNVYKFFLSNCSQANPYRNASWSRICYFSFRNFRLGTKQTFCNVR